MPTPTLTSCSEITPEEIARLPMGGYTGEILLIQSRADLEEASMALLRERVTGLDTETRPAFHKGESYLPSLVQLATAQAVYLFPVQRVDCAEVLIDVLQAPKLIKAGIALAHDLRQLRQLIPCEPRGIVDLGHLAKRHGLRQTGLRNLAALLMGIRIPKGNRTSNWASERLSPSQLRYAATDAWACRELFFRLEQAENAVAEVSG